MGLASTQDPRHRGSSLLRAAATTLAAVLIAGNQNLVNLRGDVEEGVADAEELGGHPRSCGLLRYSSREFAYWL